MALPRRSRCTVIAQYSLADQGDFITVPGALMMCAVGNTKEMPMVFHSNYEAKSSPAKGKVCFHWLVDGETKGWIHTHGMDVLGLPELEIRSCPAFLRRNPPYE